MSNGDARRRLYAEIVAAAKEGLARYYAEFPDRIGDERASDAGQWSMRGIGRILRAIDKYDVADPKPPKAGVT